MNPAKLYFITIFLWFYTSFLLAQPSILMPDGEYPVELINLTNLQILPLDNNQLYGCHPAGLEMFCDLGFSSDFMDSYNFTENPDLLWAGDFEYYCEDERLGASCDDGNSLTINVCVDENCDYMGGDVTATCRERDSLALVTLYNATHENGEWVNEWDLDLPMDTWFGVRLNGEGCVTCLDLDGEANCGFTFYASGNNLSGAIPAEIGSIQNLERLILSYNQLSSNIPLELGRLNNLSQLYLNNNELSGKIPSELEQLNNLTLLSLYNNELSGNIPPELGQLNNLTLLSLFSNELSGNIPSELGQLNNLIVLYLGYNELSGNIPSELGQLNNLALLYLNENELSGNIPPELGQLNNLIELYLNENELSGNIPPELGQLNNLTSLYLNENELSGNIPPELGQLNNLSQLWLFHNELSGNIPPELGQLNNLTSLYLNENELSGNIPPELGQLNNLSQLWLFRNELSGNIPFELGQLNNLTELYLNENELSGNIPPELGQLNNLSQLSLDSNELSGNIPSELGQLNNLIWLWLSNNELSGNIPSELGQLNNLKKLYLNDNLLENCYEIELNQFCHLESVNQNSFQEGYDFKENPLLPWQGDFSRFCAGEEQIGAPCDDGDPNTKNDVITADCGCQGCFPQQATLTENICANETYIVGEQTSKDISDGFTPNEDGINDQFVIPEIRDEPEKYPDNELVVFNRWGSIVYQQQPYDNTWKGTLMDTGQNLPAGTYYYIIRLDIGEGEIRYGQVTIIR